MTDRAATQDEDMRVKKVINDEYKIWKKNTPFLYDLIMTHALEWPSLTVQWIPDTSTRSDNALHKLILGTHTSNGEQNYLMIASIKLPQLDMGVDKINGGKSKGIFHLLERNKYLHSKHKKKWDVRKDGNKYKDKSPRRSQSVYAPESFCSRHQVPIV